MNQWYISTDGINWVLCSSAGICDPVLTLRVNGADELTWNMVGDFLADPAYGYGTTIYLASGVTTETDGVTSTSYTCRFIGRINSAPRKASPASEGMSYKASGGWWWLEQIFYAQQWQVMDSASNQLVDLNMQRVVLGQTDDTEIIDSGAQIAAAVNYAIEVGAPLAMGTVDTLANLPVSEHICVRCADVLRQMLRWQPDVCCFFNYNTRNGSGVPVATFMCRQAANLTAINLPAINAMPDSLTMTPRYDLLMPGISIIYERTITYNGAATRSFYTDSAPSPLPSDPRVISLYFELGGGSLQTVQQTVSVAAYQASYTDVGFWNAQLPWLDSSLITSVSVANVTRSGSKNYPNYLTDGTVTDWMLKMSNMGTEQETWEADVTYTRNDENGNQQEVITKHVKVGLLSTNFESKLYSAISSSTSAEPVPSGLAAQIYASWSRLQWDGKFRLVEDEASFTLVPGNRVNLTGGRAEWATMNALVQEIAVDLNAGATDITTGTCGRIEADSLVALVRAAHFWKFSNNYLCRDNANASANGNSVSGGTNLPKRQTDSADPGVVALKRVTAQDSLQNNQAILLDPSLVAFANSGDAQAVKLQPIELSVLVGANGAYSIQKAQVLACQPYSTPIPLPGSNALFAITQINGAVVTIGVGMLRRAGGIYTASGGGSITITAAGQWIAAAFDGSSLSIQGPFSSVPPDSGGMAYFPLYQMAYNVGANGPQTWPTLDCRNMLFPAMLQP